MSEIRTLVPENKRTPELRAFNLVTAKADGSICCAGDNLCETCNENAEIDDADEVPRVRSMAEQLAKPAPGSLDAYMGRRAPISEEE